MQSTRHTSQHKFKNCLFESLRKQRQLSNRIAVLLLEREKKLKIIQKRMKLVHKEHSNKIQKSLRRQQIQKSFENQKRTQIYNSQIFRQLKNDLSSSIHHKQAILLQTRQQMYKTMKKTQQTNRNKINEGKQSQLQVKRHTRHKIKLMQINSKQKIKQYWNDRVGYIHENKQKDIEQQSKLYQNCQISISQLQTRQKKILEQIEKSRMLQENIRNMSFQNIVTGEQIFALDLQQDLQTITDKL